ncbi:hypothetical protein C8R44DRAFT_879308 [Mycena epipterygia]|nr:hypothetical protein C8R44DRAFT_879308 [Mycena epipterygia]
MSALSETTISLLTSAPPMSATANITTGVVVLTMMALIVHYASPKRLTRVLVAAIQDTENAYLAAIEAGVLSKSDVHTAARLSSLQIKVSHIREVTLSSSLSYFGVLRDFFKGRSFVILKCIHDVRSLEAEIEILKEGNLRDPDSLALRAATQMVSLRQRQRHSHVA